MRHGTWSALSLATATAVTLLCAGVVGAAPPPPAQAASRPGTAAAQTGTQMLPFLPNIAVTNAWIGPGDPPPGLYAQLGHSPWVGETVTLGCEFTITGNVPANTFKVAWVIDGVNTCGEGSWTLHDPPQCDFVWPFATGTQAALTWVAHTAGPHTFQCRADTGGQVKESNESDNSRTVAFTALKFTLQHGPPVPKPLPPSPYGVRIRQ